MMFHDKVFAFTFIENLCPFLRLAAVCKKPNHSPRTSLRTFQRSSLQTRTLRTRLLYSWLGDVEMTSASGGFGSGGEAVGSNICKGSSQLCIISCR